jgi:hypothetical protein
LAKPASGKEQDLTECIASQGPTSKDGGRIEDDSVDSGQLLAAREKRRKYQRLAADHHGT